MKLHKKIIDMVLFALLHCNNTVTVSASSHHLLRFPVLYLLRLQALEE